MLERTSSEPVVIVDMPKFEETAKTPMETIFLRYVKLKRDKRGLNQGRL